MLAKDGESCTVDGNVARAGGGVLRAKSAWSLDRATCVRFETFSGPVKSLEKIWSAGTSQGGQGKRISVAESAVVRPTSSGAMCKRAGYQQMRIDSRRKCWGTATTTSCTILKVY
jgi:hypothetical protein